MPLSRSELRGLSISAGEPSRDRRPPASFARVAPDASPQFRHPLDLLGREPAEVVPVVGEPRATSGIVRFGPAHRSRSAARLLDRTGRIRARPTETR